MLALCAITKNYSFEVPTPTEAPLGYTLFYLGTLMALRNMNSGSFIQKNISDAFKKYQENSEYYARNSDKFISFAQNNATQVGDYVFLAGFQGHNTGTDPLNTESYQQEAFMLKNIKTGRLMTLNEAMKEVNAKYAWSNFYKRVGIATGAIGLGLIIRAGLKTSPTLNSY